MATLRLAIDAQKAQDGAKKFNTAAASVQSGAYKAVTSINSMAKSILALAGIGSMAYFIRQQMEAMDSTAKLSDRIGMTTESIVALQYAAKLTGIEQESLNQSLDMFSRKLGEIENGSESSSDSLKALGLTENEIAGIGLDKAFDLVADRIDNLSSKSQQAAVVQDLFGRSSQKLINLFNEGSAGIKAAREETEKLGISFSRIDAGQVELANDALTTMKESIRGVFIQLLPEISPYIEAFANELTTVMTSGDGVANTISNQLYPAVKGITTGIAYFNDGLRVMNTGFKTIEYGGLKAFTAIAKGLASVEKLLDEFNNTVAKTWAGKKLGFEVTGSGNDTAALVKTLESNTTALRKEIDTLIAAPFNQDNLDTAFAKIDAMIATSKNKAAEIAASGYTGLRTTNSEGSNELSSIRMTSKQKADIVASMYSDMGKYGEEYYAAIGILLDDQVKQFKVAGASDVEIAKWRANELKRLEDEIALQKASTVSGMYADMGNYGDEYWNATKVLLDDQVKQFEAAGASDVDAAKWRANELKKLEDEIAESRKNAIDRWVDSYGDMDDVWAGLEEGYANSLDNLGSELTNWMKTGEMDWESWRNSLLTSWMDTLNKMAVATAQESLVNPLINSVVGGIVSAWGGGSGIADGVVSDPQIGEGTATGYVGHTGGYAGEVTTRRMVPSSLLANAPRMHSGKGLGNNEVVLIAEKDELLVPDNKVVRRSNNSSGQSGNSQQQIILRPIIVRNEQEAFKEFLRTPKGQKAIMYTVANNKDMLG